MPHMVIFRDAEGKPGYHTAEGLDEAVRFVEELRNDREVSDTRVFAMQEVPIEFRPYWRVEVVAGATDEVVEPEPAPVEVHEEVVQPVDVMASFDVPEPDSLDAVVTPQPVSSRFGLFGRS